MIHNGEKYIRQCLDSVLAQSYQHGFIELNILDNNSTDSTLERVRLWTMDYGLEQFLKPESEWLSSIVSKPLAGFSLIRSTKNLGMWPGQEELLKHSRGEYVIVLSVDVILYPDFIKNAVEAMARDHQIGALQAKVYKFELSQLETRNSKLETNIIDTVGFQIYRSRRIINIGHGEADQDQYNEPKEIFAVEGAVPVFRRQALEDCRLVSQGDKIIDPDFFWYGDDLDIAWRMRIFGWKQVYAPSVIAWHDRKTTKVLAGGWRELFRSRNLLPKSYLSIRGSVPMFKRRLGWRNTTLTIIKNDFASDLWCDSYYIIWRQLQIWGYFLLFEPAMFLEIFNLAKLLPRMLKRRSEIMKKSKVSAGEFRRWIS